MIVENVIKLYLIIGAAWAVVDLLCGLPPLLATLRGERPADVYDDDELRGLAEEILCMLVRLPVAGTALALTVAVIILAITAVACWPWQVAQEIGDAVRELARRDRR